MCMEIRLIQQIHGEQSNMKCEQCNWEKIDEEELDGWFGAPAGRVLLFKCKRCGRLQKVKLLRQSY